MEINKQQGFALLMTLIVVTVVLSVGMAILDVSVKQVALSTNAKDSESSFHAANAGMECARYWRRQASSTIEAGGSLTIECFNQTISGIGGTAVTPMSAYNDGDIWRYEYQIGWGTSPRCTQVTLMAMFADPTGTGLRVNATNMATAIPGYPSGVGKECDAGGQCTVIAVRGYNRACGAVSGYGSVQREVLLEF